MCKDMCVEMYMGMGIDMSIEGCTDMGDPESSVGREPARHSIISINIYKYL